MEIDMKVTDNRVLLTVRGSLNSDNAPKLQEKLNEVLKTDIKYLDIDFLNVIIFAARQSVNYSFL